MREEILSDFNEFDTLKREISEASVKLNEKSDDNAANLRTRAESILKLKIPT